MVNGHGMSVRMPVMQRVMAARGMKQAVVKVMGFSRGAKGLKDHLNYISREGRLPLEKDSGETVEGLEMQRELVRDWSADFDTRMNSRDTANIVFSMPPGSDPEALSNAVRMVGDDYFAGHEWVFAIHKDTKHPHAHMSVKMRGWERGEKLQLRKADLYELREKFAEASRKQGVPLAASSRAARGVGHKAVRQALRHLRARGIVPEVQKSAAQELGRELERGLPEEKPWEEAMRERNDAERQAYREDAQSLRAAAAQEDAASREAFLAAARDLDTFAKNMPKPKTRRQAFLERVGRQLAIRQIEKHQTQDREMDFD